MTTNSGKEDFHEKAVCPLQLLRRKNVRTRSACADRDTSLELGGFSLRFCSTRDQCGGPDVHLGFPMPHLGDGIGSPQHGAGLARTLMVRLRADAVAEGGVK
jgi:hypothetical protein